MKHLKVLFISILGIGAIVTGYGLHNHIVNVRAAKAGPYRRARGLLPPGAIGHRTLVTLPSIPSPPQLIAWLADARRMGISER